MKFAVLVLCAFLASAAAINNQWGERSTGFFWMKNDHKIYTNTIVAQPFKYNIVSRDVRFPEFMSNNGPNITYIEAIDNFRNSSGGHAVIINGGPRHNYVHLRVISQVGYGINFTIKIWGK